MNIAIYSRKSKFTGKGESTQNQVEMCREYAKKHFDVENFIIYEDEGFSGGNTDRPEYKRMINDLDKGKFNVLMCYRLDRISRNIADFSDTIETLQDNNIAFVSLKEQFDTSTPMGRAMMYIASVFAQLERETIAERIRDNMLQLARSGRWLGGNTPTGFESEPLMYLDSNMKEKKMFKLSPIKKEFDLVKLIFKKYLEFQSLSKLETYCLQNHIKTKKGKDFHKYSLRAILTNPVYSKADTYTYDYFYANNAQICNSKEEFNSKYGIMAYNKNLVKKGRSVKSKDISEWIIAIGKHKGIIEGNEWILVQNILQKNKSKAPRQGTSSAAMLSGLLRCGKCGSFLKVKYGQVKKGTDKRHYYYVCNMKDISRGERCNLPNLVGEETDEIIIEELRDRIEAGILENINTLKDDLKDKKSQNKQILIQLENNKNSIDNLLKQLSQNSSDTVAQYIFKEIEKLDNENKELKKKLEKDNTNVEIINLDILKESLVKFSDSIDDTPYDEKRNLIKNIVNKIMWNGEEFHLDLFTKDPK